MDMKEYLMAHEGEEGLPEKLNAGFLAEQGVELSDDELEQAAGGSICAGGGGNGHTAVYGWDDRGNPTHWIDQTTDKVYHFNCKYCGRILHEGTARVLYCDPCDTWFWGFNCTRVYD